MFLDTFELFTDCFDGDVMLVNSPSTSSGELRMCLNQHWGSVCGSYWNAAETNIVCRKLGFQPGGV